MKPDQDLIGQGVALIVNGNTLVAAGGFPLLGNTVTLANNVIVDGIDMTTGANNGIVGTGVTGVAVTVRHLTSTTGTAVNLNNLAGTLSFTSVSANGGTNGIAMSNTTGSFTVTGTVGSTSKDGSGGTIQNLTGADASPVETATVGVGVSMNNAQNVSLNHMNLHDFSNYAVEPDEVEEVIASRPMWRRGRKHHETGRRSIYALGRTEAGRYLFVVLAPLGAGRARCVTARDMDTAL